jgi:hypothetical protein
MKALYARCVLYCAPRPSYQTLGPLESHSCRKSSKLISTYLSSSTFLSIDILPNLTPIILSIIIALIPSRKPS